MRNFVLGENNRKVGKLIEFHFTLFAMNLKRELHSEDLKLNLRKIL